jgi:hypothetical protein
MSNETPVRRAISEEMISWYLARRSLFSDPNPSHNEWLCYSRAHTNEQKRLIKKFCDSYRWMVSVKHFEASDLWIRGDYTDTLFSMHRIRSQCYYANIDMRLLYIDKRKYGVDTLLSRCEPLLRLNEQWLRLITNNEHAEFLVYKEIVEFRNLKNIYKKE